MIMQQCVLQQESQILSGTSISQSSDSSFYAWLSHWPTFSACAIPPEIQPVSNHSLIERIKKASLWRSNFVASRPEVWISSDIEEIVHRKINRYAERLHPEH